ncbi:MAG: hypothetical protein HON76_10830 [Candidatus Scalindua sp.]|jgi:hypothetical protein|nr:hypothetical protein [Candidatus Scalindua sp.]MBT6225570.1 hypothetical protein [Candidatus Scalindua sp.]MBT6563007.1 hypothetical protein [Candidatus Scalindua sp.]
MLFSFELEFEDKYPMELGVARRVRDVQLSLLDWGNGEKRKARKRLCVRIRDGSGSRYDVAVEFIRLLGLEKEINIDIVDSEYFKEEYFAPRPHSEKLLNLKLSSRGINYMKAWRICLEDYVKSYKPLLEIGS